MGKLIDFIFPRRKKKFPKQIEYAIREYKQLCMEGCLVIPCKKCRHLMEINEHRYTCKRNYLMNLLWEDYREEVEKIDSLFK